MLGEQGAQRICLYPENMASLGSRAGDHMIMWSSCYDEDDDDDDEDGMDLMMMIICIC